MTDPVAAAPAFPFGAVVGHDDAKLALAIHAVDRRVGGVLLRGDKGSAKTTLARGLAAVLGPGTPWVELPVSATEDRVVGSIDIDAALGAGGVRFQPGLLAAADGGVLYVDEINLLPDHLVDVLLDVAASGINRVEREGISETHPSRFVLIGSMNPEEGDLRPQLLDRFGLAVDVLTPLDATERALAVTRRLAFDADPAAFASQWPDTALAAQLAAARPASLPPDLIATVSSLCASVGAQGLRADLVICRAAAALAGIEGRTEATVEDVRRVAPLALAHRRRRSPLDDPGIEQQEIDDALDPPSMDPPPPGASTDPPPPAADPSSAVPPPADVPDSGPSPEPAPPNAGGAARPERAGSPRPVVTIAALSSDGPSGRRSPAEGARGRVVGARTVAGPVTDLAVGATVRASAQRVAATGAAPGVVTADLRQAVREERVGNLVVLAVDASASMGVQRRMAAVKEAVLSLLVDAYQRRDRVALVTFAGEQADVVLRPTGSVEVARARLDELRTGGRTPLAAGIDAALALALRSDGGRQPLLVLVSDGRATAGASPLEAARAAAARVARHRIPAVVVDTEDGATRLGLAAELAAAMGATHLPLPEVTGEGLRRIVLG